MYEWPHRVQIETKFENDCFKKWSEKQNYPTIQSFFLDEDALSDKVKNCWIVLICTDFEHLYMLLCNEIFSCFYFHIFAQIMSSANTFYEIIFLLMKISLP